MQNGNFVAKFIYIYMEKLFNVKKWKIFSTKGTLLGQMARKVKQ